MPALQLPDKPSIAALPFLNLGGDPAQEYFADGVVEDIIAALSRIGWLFVVARNSRLTYKGRAVDVKQQAGPPCGSKRPAWSSAGSPKRATRCARAAPGSLPLPPGTG